jgi:hypothetical protein
MKTGNADLDTLIEEGIRSGHFPLSNSVWAGIRRRGGQLARESKKRETSKDSSSPSTRKS